MLEGSGGGTEARRGRCNLLRTRRGIPHVAASPIAGRRAVGDVCKRRLELGHREERPLVGQRPLVTARRRQESGIWAEIGELQADGRRLEDQPLTIVEYGNPGEWMAATMRRARLLCLRHNGQLVRGTELSEHPEHTL